jgi:hypothetical protein
MELKKLSGIRYAMLSFTKGHWDYKIFAGGNTNYRAIDDGEKTYVQMLQNHCPARQNITLKIGAQVGIAETKNSMLSDTTIFSIEYGLGGAAQEHCATGWVGQWVTWCCSGLHQVSHWIILKLWIYNKHLQVLPQF